MSRYAAKQDAVEYPPRPVHSTQFIRSIHAVILHTRRYTMSKEFCWTMYQREKAAAKAARNPIDKRKHEAHARQWYGKYVTAHR